MGTVEPSTSKRPRRLFESDSKSCVMESGSKRHAMESGSKRLSITNRRDLAEMLEGPAGRMSCNTHPAYIPEDCVGVELQHKGVDLQHGVSQYFPVQEERREKHNLQQPESTSPTA